MRAYGSKSKVSICGCCGGGKARAGIKGLKSKARKAGKASARKAGKAIAAEMVAEGIEAENDDFYAFLDDMAFMSFTS
jgi:hypothetical protein